jgi:hypothetical protein
VTQIPEGLGNELLPHKEHGYADSYEDDTELYDLDRDFAAAHAPAPSANPHSQGLYRANQSSNHLFHKQRRVCGKLYIRTGAGCSFPTELKEGTKIISSLVRLFQLQLLFAFAPGNLYVDGAYIGISYWRNT